MYCKNAELSLKNTHVREGVIRYSVLDAGLSPFGPEATTPTLYWVPGFRPVKSTFGVEVETVMGAPPPMGVAVKV